MTTPTRKKYLVLAASLDLGMGQAHPFHLIVAAQSDQEAWSMAASLIHDEVWLRERFDVAPDEDWFHVGHDAFYVRSLDELTAEPPQTMPPPALPEGPATDVEAAVLDLETMSRLAKSSTERT